MSWDSLLPDMIVRRGDQEVMRMGCAWWVPLLLIVFLLLALLIKFLIQLLLS